MSKKKYPNTEALHAAGVSDPTHREILLGNMPCGETSVAAVLRDDTPFQINGPRAIMICHWKGMLHGFRLLEAARLKRAQRRSAPQPAPAEPEGKGE